MLFVPTSLLCEPRSEPGQARWTITRLQTNNLQLGIRFTDRVWLYLHHVAEPTTIGMNQVMNR